MRASHTLAAALAVAAVGGSAVAQSACEGQPTGVRLDIVVDGVRSDRGLMTATLYPPLNAKFLKPSGEIAVWRVPAKAPTTQMCIWLAAPGAYAVALYDDLNSNHRFDHTLVLPLEPYGFSNDPRLFLGPPSASAARFAVGPGGATIRIHLHYPAGVGGPAPP
jgi:uncharacterized protein (DUF2141 family)